MKKILILSVIFLVGIFSVSAQSSWEVYIDWEIAFSSDSEFQDLPDDKFVVYITIYDEANDNTVVLTMGDYVGMNEFEIKSLFKLELKPIIS